MKKFSQHLDKFYAGYAFVLYVYCLIFLANFFGSRLWAASRLMFIHVNETVITVSYLVVFALALGLIVSLLSVFFLWKKKMIGKVLTHIMLWLNLIGGVVVGWLVYDIEGRYAKSSWYVSTWQWMFVVLVICSILGLWGLFTRWNPRKRPASLFPPISTES